jgi:hypothetical protein
MLIVSGAISALGTGVGIAVPPVSAAVALINTGVLRVKGCGEGVGVPVGVAVGLGVNVGVAVGVGDGGGTGVAVGVQVGGTGVCVAVGGTEVGTGDDVGTKSVGASVGSVNTDTGFPLVAMMPSNPPMATSINAGAIHFSRVIPSSSPVQVARPILILSRI